MSNRVNLIVAGLALVGLAACAPATGAPSTPATTGGGATTAVASTAVATPTSLPPTPVIGYATAIPAPTGGPFPRATSSPTSSTPPTPLPASTAEVPPVTLNDTGKTVALHVGQSFLLNLGEGYDWTVTVADQNVLRRKVNVLPIKGAQGVYEAVGSGNTTLTASGDAPCRQAQPPCAMPSRLFEIKVAVVQ